MSKRTFEIGLVGAGAISAGAYTAGVIDFLIQALDAWYDSKANDVNVPQHDVKLSVFSGASAGSITAALAAGYLGSAQEPVTTEAEGDGETGTQNKLFDSWVNRIDIESLLESSDLAATEEDEAPPVKSLLDSSILRDIADSGLDVVARQQKRPYIADNFEVLMTVTNLRGVPYKFEMTGDKLTDYDMSLHADYVHFRINEDGNEAEADRYMLKWQDFTTGSENKEKFKLAALASGAFPIGLSPRDLKHKIEANQTDWYSDREWAIPTPNSTDPHQCTTLEKIPANWGKNIDFDYTFQCVDGGVMNNEPFELARRILAGPNGRNIREGQSADKALLLIDPFPNYSPFKFAYKPAPDLFNIAKQLFGALKNQARFKPDELKLADSPDVFSRFMIAPKRIEDNGQTARFPIACGLLGGFGGFLSRKFREHNFFLGRRNAQKFLMHHFVLPENNRLFDEPNWNEEMKQRYCVRNKQGEPVLKDGLRQLPIIPIIDAVKAPCFEPKWPTYTYDELNVLTGQIDGRVDAVFDRLVEQYFKTNHLIVRFIAKIIVRRKKNETVEYIRETVKDDLINMALIEDIR